MFNRYHAVQSFNWTKWFLFLWYMLYYTCTCICKKMLANLTVIISYVGHLNKKANIVKIVTVGC